jgi:hypothetical protein
MYVGYVLDKDSPVYPGPARPASLGLGPQAYGPPAPPPATPQYPDFAGYTHSHVESPPAPPSAWGAPFHAPKDDWTAAYGPGPAAPAASPASLAFGPPPDFSPVPAPPGSGPGLLAQPLGGPGAPSPPGAQRRTPYEWMRRSVAVGGGGGSGKDPSLAWASGRFPRHWQGPGAARAAPCLTSDLTLLGFESVEPGPLFPLLSLSLLEPLVAQPSLPVQIGKLRPHEVKTSSCEYWKVGAGRKVPRLLS